MVNADKKRFASSLGKSAIAFSKGLTQEHITVLWEILIDYEIDAVEIAVSQHMRTGHKFPVPADIIELIPKKLTKQKKGDVIMIDGKAKKVLN